MLNKVKQNPEQKMQSIVQMVQKLFKMKKWDEWDIQIEDKPSQLTSRRLAAPELVHREGDDKQLFVNERLLKMMPVYSCEDLKQTQLFLIHDKYSNREAQNVLENLRKCQGQIGIRANDIETLFLPDCRGNFKKIEETIQEYLEDLKQNAGSKIKNFFAIVIVEKRHDYPRLKSMLTRMNVLSQMIVKQTAFKINLSVASNIMK